MQTNQSALLYQLQVHDLSIAKQKARIAEITALLNADEAVTKAKSKVAASEETLKPLQARAVDLDLEIKALTAKIQESDAHLYSGTVTSVKELSELQEEGESLKRRAAQLEQTQLDLMMQIEGEQSKLDSLQGALKDVLDAKSVERAELRKEGKAISAEVNAEIQTRIDFAKRIDPNAIRSYENLRTRMRGTPVALMSSADDSCTICGVEQTSMVAKQVRQGDKITFCGNCGRILVAV